MRRFELVEGSASKFWSIELTGNMFTVVYGRIGSAGTTQEKTFDDDAKAKKEYDKLVAEKTKKGYAEVEPVAQTGTPSVKATPAPKPATEKAADKAEKPAKKNKAAKDDADDVVDAAAAPVAAAPAASPKAPPSAAEENQVFWTDALKKRVLPRRGGVDAKIAALPTKAKAKAALQAALTPRATYLDTVVEKKNPGANELQKAVGIVAEGGDIDVETAAILVSWVNWSPDYKTESDPDVAVDFLVATYGYATATSAVLIALEQSFLDRTGGQGTSLQQSPADGWNNSFVRGGSLQGVDRLRELLVLASDDERAAARAVADKARTSELAHAATTILFPEDGDLVAEDILLFSKGGGFAWVLGSVTDMSTIPPQQGIEVSTLIPYRYRKSAAADIAATLLDGVGMAAAPFFAALEEPPYANTEMNKSWFGVLAAIGDDATVARVVDAIETKEAQAALVEAAVNQPRRLLRLLGKKAATRGKVGEPARNVLATIVRRVPEIVDELLPHLEADAAKAIKALVEDAGEVVADADVKDLPAVLTSPPWHSKKAKAAGPSKPGLEIKAVAPATSWANKERDKYDAKAGWTPTTYDADGWKSFVKGNASVDYNDLANAPAEHVPALLARGVNGGRWNTAEWYPRLVARHGVNVVDLLVARLADDAAGLLPHLVPLGETRFAMPMATSLATKKTLRDAARSWLVRHPTHAAAGLLPTALGKAGKDRDHAEAALRFIASNGGEAALLDVADDNGVKSELAQILAASPLDKHPAKPPKLPAFVDAAALPRPVLTGGKGALSVEATTALIEMLAFSPVDDPYAGIDVVREACEPKSLARFVWAVFQAWLVNGAPSKEGWCMSALGVFGDDDAARKLAAYAREWPGESANARAVSALDVLATIGTDVALMHLNAIALKSKFKGLQTKAQEKIEVIAETRGLSREELEDRLAPDLNLDDDGSLKLDFGTRTFTVGFDEALRPFVKDHTGARLKDLPKPKQTDDEEKAKNAAETWSQLKKDAKQAASLQILRLEMAMCGQRRFPAKDFVELFVSHPLVIHIVRRLVWATYDDAGKVKRTFRVAEDRTFANDDDDGFVLDDTATVGIPHPLELGDATTAKWSQIFGDYELVQPFAQLGRPVFIASETQKAAKSIDVVKGVEVKTGKVLGLEQRRWRRGSPQDAGVVCWMEKHLADGRVVMLDLDPGLYTGMLSESPDQKLGTATIGASHRWGGVTNAEDIGTLDAVTYSELVRDLEGLKS